MHVTAGRTLDADLTARSSAAPDQLLIPIATGHSMHNVKVDALNEMIDKARKDPSVIVHQASFDHQPR